MNRRLYALHRWISAIAFVQLALWTVSGLFFSVVPEKTLKGAPVSGAHVAPLPEDGLVAPQAILSSLAKIGPVERLELTGGIEGPAYRAKVGERRFRFDARTGKEWPVDADEAARIAARDQPGSPRALTVERIERDAPIEYRAKPLPAFRVHLADEAGTMIYVDASTGDVTARRNDVWRIYDFLWGLHLMDYRGRDTRNHPLLAVAAVIACLTVVSGAVLWALRLVRRWRRPHDARGVTAPVRRRARRESP